MPYMSGNNRHLHNIMPFILCGRNTDGKAEVYFILLFYLFIYFFAYFIS